MKQSLRTIAKATGMTEIVVQTWSQKNSSTKPRIHNLPVTKEAIDDTVEELAGLNEAGAHVGVLPQVSDGRGRSKENIERICYLVVDLDRQATVDEINALAVRPSIIVETSPGQYHLYFRAKCPVGVYEERTRALIKVLDADKQASDRSRAFRLAGTINWKPEHRGFVAQLVNVKPDAEPMSAKRIVRKLSGKVDKPQAASAKSAPDTSSRDGISAEKVQALLNKIPADDRSVWLHVGMALHSWNPTKGFALWDTWSKSAPEKYEAGKQHPTWNGFVQGRGRSISTLFYYAKTLRGAITSDKTESLLPVHDTDIAKYAIQVLSGKLKIAGEQFYSFTEQGWRKDKKVATRMLMEVIGDLYEVAKMSATDFARKMLKPKLGFGAAQRLLAEFHGFGELDVDESKFDAKPNVLGVPNGVVDLSTGQFRKARPSDMVSLSTAAKYDVNATCPKFEKFIAQIAPSAEYLQYLQTLLGYLLIGSNREQHAYFMLGKGGNGKGTLTRIVEKVMGDAYCEMLSPAFVKNASKSSGNGPTPAIMKLRHARAIFCTESERKRGVDELFFKQLTGNDALSGRHLYGEQVTFQPRGKLILTTNTMPDWAHEDDALWRRVVVLPFTKAFKGEKRNNDLDNELAAEASGVLNWMIKGAVQYLESGFPTCCEVEKATAHARQQADTVQTWIEEECEEDDGEELRAREAYEAYTVFTKRKRVATLSNKQFSARLKELGYHRRRKSDGFNYKGLRHVKE